MLLYPAPDENSECVVEIAVSKIAKIKEVLPSAREQLTGLLMPELFSSRLMMANVSRWSHECWKASSFQANGSRTEDT